MLQRIIPIKGDGNCLFNTLSYCMYNSINRIKKMRSYSCLQNWGDCD